MFSAFTNDTISDIEGTPAYLERATASLGANSHRSNHCQSHSTWKKMCHCVLPNISCLLLCKCDGHSDKYCNCYCNPYCSMAESYY